MSGLLPKRESPTSKGNYCIGRLHSFILLAYLNQQNVKATIIIIMGRSTWKVPLEMTITEEVLRQSTE